MDCNDLEVFVLTYNRAEWLKIQLESICNQTASGFKIRVLNNASTDNTAEVVNSLKAKYPEREIELITHPQNIGNPNNFKKSQELASRKYCAVFHDDDCVHPTYIERAMECLYNYPDAVMCSCHVEPYYNVTADNWGRKSPAYYLIDKDDFAFLMLQGDRPSFAASIYRTDIYKSCTYHNDLCGKIHDLPFTFEVCSKGKSILLEDSFLRYRLSPVQDSADPSTGPFPEQVANALKLCFQTAKKKNFYLKARMFFFARMLYFGEKSVCSAVSFKAFRNMLLDKGIFSSRREVSIIKHCTFFYRERMEKLVSKGFKKTRRAG